MKTIWKVALAVTDIQDIEVPLGLRFLCVQVQRGEPCLWFQFDMPEDGKPKLAKRKIRIVGTGHFFEPRGPYLGTFQTHGGALVFHVYEEH